MSDLPLPPPRLRTPVAPAETPGTSGLMTLATGVVVVAALSIARDVLIPITLAVLLSFILAPVVDLLRRLRLRRMPAVLIAMLLALGVILGLGAVIGTQLASLATDAPRYASAIEDKIQAAQGMTAGRLSDLLERLARQGARASKAALPTSRPATPAARNAAAAPVPVEIREPPASPAAMAQRILAPALAPLATTGIVFVVAMFILLQQEDLRDRLIRLFGARDLHRTMMAMDDAGRRLGRYFLTQLALNATFGCLIGAGLLLIGVPNPVLWGIVATLMRFVPYMGSILAAALPLTLAAAVDPGWSMVLWTAALFLITEGIMGQAVEPLVYGHSTGLSPVSVVVAAIFWGWLWGPIGLILSMPLTLCLVVLGRHVDRLEFLDVLLGNRPALTPAENFYHRMLAGDVDEVQDFAETALKTRALSLYYDEIAIPGLQLAATDIARDVLSEMQIARIREGVAELLGELSDADEGEPAAPSGEAPEPPPAPLPPAWCAPAAVLCIAGRGPLDDMASAMLAQVLGKHGLGASVAPHATVGSRATLLAQQPEGVLMVCLCYAHITGTPSHLRYAIRRLRKRLPGVVILVGLWPEDAIGDQRLRAAVDADRYAASLREMVAACLAEARRAPVGLPPTPIDPIPPDVIPLGAQDGAMPATN